MQKLNTKGRVDAQKIMDKDGVKHRLKDNVQSTHKATKCAKYGRNVGRKTATKRQQCVKFGHNAGRKRQLNGN